MKSDANPEKSLQDDHQMIFSPIQNKAKKLALLFFLILKDKENLIQQFSYPFMHVDPTILTFINKYANHLCCNSKDSEMT